MQYWIDTDPGLDDALAILLAIREVGDSLVGLSSVQGNGEEPRMALNLLRILTTCAPLGRGLAAWTPAVARGASQPLAGGSPERGELYHGEDYLGGLDWTAGADWSTRVGAQPAAVAIIETARRVPDLQLVCIGPLTNVALALGLEPELPALVAGLTIMGGSLRAGGNQTLAAEFNFLTDPEAASLVLEAGFRNVGLVPIDVCQEARLFEADMLRLAGLQTDASRTAGELLRYFAGRGQPGRGVPFYDPTAWLLTTRPELAEWETVYVGVDTGRDIGRGASLADWQARARREPNLRAATRLLDRPAFIDHFLELLAD